MKEETIKEFKVIANTNLTDFEREVKSFLESHRNAISLQLNSTTIESGHFAHIQWDEKRLIPENIKDEYLLRGEKYHCKNCPHWGANGSENPREAFDCLKRVKDRARGCEEACLYFYKELAKGDIRPYEP